MEGIERIGAKAAVLVVADRVGESVVLKPLPNVGEVVLVDEGEAVALEGAIEVDGDYPIGLVLGNSMHYDGQCAIVSIFCEVKRYFFFY